MEVAARGLASLAQVVDALLPHDAGRHHGQQDAAAQQQPADTHLQAKGMDKKASSRSAMPASVSPIPNFFLAFSIESLLS